MAEWLRCPSLNSRVMGLSPTWAHCHDTRYDSKTCWLQEYDSFVIYLSCIHLFHNQTKIMMFKLTLILLEPKVISFCHQYRPRPVCTSVRSDQALYCWLTKPQILTLKMNSTKKFKVGSSI